MQRLRWCRGQQIRIGARTGKRTRVSKAVGCCY